MERVTLHRQRNDDKWMKETAAAIQPGTAALFVLVRKVTADKVLEGLKGEGGTVLKTSLDHTKEEALKAALAGAQAAVPLPEIVRGAVLSSSLMPF